MTQGKDVREMTEGKQKTWLITGADKGLGFQTARTALERGDNVVVTVLAADGVHDLAADYPDRLRAFHLDARDQARVGTVVARAVEAFGRIDVLVNNAGYGLVALAEATGADKYRPLFEVNFFGLVEITRAVLPIMRKQRSGHVINLSSYAGFIGTPGFGFYAATKFAVEGYSESLSREVKHLGINVTVIEPGGFRSDFAGASLDQNIDTLGEDYAPVAETVADYSARRHGKQPNDPELFGLALCAVADAEEPPFRLPLGRDAHAAILKDIEEVTDELERWKELSFSTHRPL
ncbi:SDR family NAD(P)-dependent oxidoreductase [Salipiger abyssi]|uniref:SDR family NAD(P)-dependent oxidoreductase n=1 Tax=Salipiger abyssi TaxID=1250539 RepID=UPI001A8D0E28|nr:SDR family NAD(P)-dependent oxidoreductase [Salipiger abyssi]MBN9889298.1 SDR family NAD(P)-dependent oxidoreductase [Salipiger abyssi]